MKTTALRIYGKEDLRLESFELPPCGDDGIIAEVNAVTDYNDVKTMSEEDALAAGLLVYFGKEVDDAYMEALKMHVKLQGR